MKLPPGVSAFLSRRLLDRRDGHRGRVLAALAAARAHDRLDRAALDAARDRALYDLLRHAAARVPRFRGLPVPAQPAEARAVLANWPVMTRADLQREPSAFLDPQAGPTVADATGGSTGTPMSFQVDRPTQIAREASLMWADGLGGWDLGQRIAMLWGADRDVQLAHRSWRGGLRLLIENRRWYNAFDMGPERMAEYHRCMTAFQPHLLVAYAGSLDVFARWLDSTGQRPTYPLGALVSSAEMLAPEVRQRVERVFGRPVFDRYGNRETGAIAAECVAHQGLHINEADFLVEVLSPDPYRQPGPLVVTYFPNRAHPFIRYDTGDVGVLLPPGHCACGRFTTRLARIVGRQSDTIRTPGGRWIHGEYFTHLLYGTDAVRAFQFVQERPDRYCLRLQAAASDCCAREADWLARIRAEVGEGAAVRIEYVDHIPVTASGKRKFVISLVSGCDDVLSSAHLAGGP